MSLKTPDMLPEAADVGGREGLGITAASRRIFLQEGRKEGVEGEGDERRGKTLFG